MTSSVRCSPLLQSLAEGAGASRAEVNLVRLSWSDPCPSLLLSPERFCSRDGPAQEGLERAHARPVVAQRVPGHEGLSPAPDDARLLGIAPSRRRRERPQHGPARRRHRAKARATRRRTAPACAVLSSSSPPPRVDLASSARQQPPPSPQSASSRPLPAAKPATSPSRARASAQSSPPTTVSRSSRRAPTRHRRASSLSSVH